MPREHCDLGDLGNFKNAVIAYFQNETLTRLLTLKRSV